MSAEVYQLGAHNNMTVEECLELCKRENELKIVIVAGYNEDEELIVRSSHISRADALWLVEDLKDHIRRDDRA